MMLVDTNVLVDVLEDDPAWVRWSLRQLQVQSKVHQLVINPIIYAELSLTFSRAEDLDSVLDQMELPVLEVPRPALFLAGKAYAQYRSHKGTKNNVLPDFFIGAHAAVSQMPILTRDPRRYRTYFNGLTLISPSP